MARSWKNDITKSAGQPDFDADHHAILEAKIGRAVYAICEKKVPFDAKRFLAS